MSSDNSILEAWRESAKHWTRHQAHIHAMLAPLTQALIEAAGIHEGQSVIDVACGAGEPSLTIAVVVGPKGSVTSTDATPQMVQAAEKEATRGGLTNMQFHECKAESLPFPDHTFDVAVSRLGVMLFSDPLVGVREMLRVTKPKGTVAFAVWHKSELNPFCYLVSDAVARHVESPPVDPDAPGAFRFAEEGKLARLLREAGATEVEERVFKFNIEATLSPLEFWAMRSQMSDTLRDKLNKLSADEQTQIANEVQEAVKDYFPGNQMRFPTQMIIVTGKVAAD
jgi:ubiquinone/menaquinone biosynthesis C-methylase UbiE